MILLAHTYPITQNKNTNANAHTRSVTCTNMHSSASKIRPHEHTQSGGRSGEYLRRGQRPVVMGQTCECTQTHSRVPKTSGLQNNVPAAAAAAAAAASTCGGGNACGNGPDMRISPVLCQESMRSLMSLT